MKGIAGIATISALTAKVGAAETGEGNSDLDEIKMILKAHDAAMTDQNLDGILAVMSPKAVLMGTGPGEIWSGPEEIKDAYTHFFADFDKGQQDFKYTVHFAGLTTDMGWLMTSGDVKGKKDGKDFSFPLNISLTVAKADGKWKIVAMHFSTLIGGTDEKQPAK